MWDTIEFIPLHWGCLKIYGKLLCSFQMSRVTFVMSRIVL